jgi:hypothetical protein
MLRSPRCLGKRLANGGEVSFAHLPRFFPFLVLISIRGCVSPRAIMRPECSAKLGSIVALSGIASSTVRLIARLGYALDTLDIRSRSLRYTSACTPHSVVRLHFFFEVYLLLKNGVFWVVTPCGSCKNRRFGGTWRLLHQGDQVDLVFLRSVRRLLRGQVNK